MIRLGFKKELSVEQLFIQSIQESFITFGLCSKHDDYVDLFELQKLELKTYGIRVTLTMPVGVCERKIMEVIHDVGESLYCKIKVQKIRGRDYTFDFAFDHLGRVVDFHLQNCSHPDSLLIQFPSFFGNLTIDLHKDQYTHLLIAGATGMGKTGVLLYLLTLIMHQLSGKVQILLATVKLSDFVPFRNIPQIQFSNSDAELEAKLEGIIEEGKRRASLMEQYYVSKIDELRLVCPDEELPPIFVVIDEFARYADEKTIQDMVTHIAETYRYVDIHLIIATQRPDVQTVLKARIRANILTRIVLTMADEANSRLILPDGRAAYLGRIEGRAIVYDGEMNEVQVPYIRQSECSLLMNPFRSVTDDTKRSNDYSVPEEVPCDEPGPTGKTGVSRSRKSRKHDQPYLEEIIKGFTHPSDPTA